MNKLQIVGTWLKHKQTNEKFIYTSDMLEPDPRAVEIWEPEEGDNVCCNVEGDILIVSYFETLPDGEHVCSTLGTKELIYTYDISPLEYVFVLGN